MKGFVLFILYALAGWAAYMILRWRQARARDPDEDEGLHIFFAMIWPLTAFGFLYYIYLLVIQSDRYAAPNRPSEPMARWEPKPPAGDYNSNNLGRFPDEDPEEMAHFIKAMETRPDAPLPDALTFSYKLTGISKTYPKGTMFPSALVRDWKRGYYMGDEKEV